MHPIVRFALLASLVACGGSGTSAPSSPPPTPTAPTAPVIPTTPAALTVARTRTHELTVDGVKRSFIVYSPGGASTTDSLPVVFMLHGTSGDGEKFYNTSQWKEKCETVKCIAIFPSSLEYCIIDDGVQKRTTKWHTKELENLACAGQTLADDVKFFRQMVGDLRTNYRIDGRRVYVSGFSNGAGMSSLLWAAASDLLAAAASSAGFNADSTVVSTSRVPYFFTIGELDDNLAQTIGFKLPLPLNETALNVPWFKLVGSQALSRLGLSQTHTTTIGATGVSFHFATPASPNAEMYFWVVKGLAHQYANGTNYPIRYADVFWEFFARHSR